MTLFEYISVAVSLVMSLCVVRLLDGLRFAATRQRRYWVHLLWVLTKLLNCAIFWWVLWAVRESTPWNFASFMWVLLFPGTLYLQCTALVTTTPSEISTWRDHFYAIRRWFFAMNLLLVGYALFSSAIFLSAPLLDLSRAPMAVLFLLNVLGVLSASPRLHGVLAVIAFLANLLGFGAAFFQPDMSAAA
jgi:hypothetical protein